jgi:nicotinate-nucleotide adenylyltransferase
VRIGILGGTFDPPHIGHLLAATDACELLDLTQLIFVPTATQPLKAGLPASSADDRLAMVRLLAEQDPRFSVEDVEVRRGGLSFTVDTLRMFRERWPAGTADLVLLLGVDAAAQFPLWKEPETVLALAQVVVMTRGEQPGPGLAAGLTSVATRRVDMSSTEVRERVRGGRTVRGLVTEEVAAYIERRRLYR